MKRRQWKPEEKLKIVMEGLRAAALSVSYVTATR